MAFDRAGGDEGHLRDLSVGEILACEFGYSAFARGQ
jgi:hypothetical protein